MRIVFRTDSSLLMGSGHLIRCLTLANELRVRGVEIIFITREHPGHLIDKLDEAGYCVCRLLAPQPQGLIGADDYAGWLGVSVEQDVAETLAILRQYNIDLLVVDHYGLDAYWEKLIRPSVNRILVIDDIANREHDCDLLLDQNYFGENTALRYLNLVPDSCKCLLGPRYALLRPEYSESHKILPVHTGQIKRVLVFFGSVDPSDQTGKVVAALSCPSLAHLIVDVVIGANYSNLEAIEALIAKRPNTMLHQDLPSLSTIMASVDLVIGAGGSTTWERLCLGKPSLVISIAENQQEFTHALTINHFQVSITKGNLTLASDWRKVVCQMIKQPELVAQLAKNARCLVDGLGAKRIARVILRDEGVSLRLRQVRHEDEIILFDWVNDIEVRKQSFRQELISLNDHAQWFAAKYSDPNSCILIGEDEVGLPIGQVRFEMNQEQTEATIGISIEGSLRGMGLSKILLARAIQHWQAIKPKVKLIAEVRDENQRSQQLFKSLKFTGLPSRRIGACTFELVF
jgi:UDP-2,4-diacetamido-2,4,6-trideoxy-beta-L-altropyranose hydrolase